MKILLARVPAARFPAQLSWRPYRSVGGLKGKKNGELLRAAEVAGYDVLLTVDQGIPRDNDLAGRKLSVILIRSRTNQLEDLLHLFEPILQALRTVQPGQAVVVPFPEQ
ncbi:MAG: hypothetical protein ABSE42_01275 [Bryobacteraceae bacterium]|jgi:hypothetical protein